MCQTLFTPDNAFPYNNLAVYMPDLLIIWTTAATVLPVNIQNDNIMQLTQEKECLVLDASWVATAEVTTDALRWTCFNLVLQINVYTHSY